MIKKHKKSAVKLMRRSARVYLNELNVGKANQLKAFLRTCHDLTQYFIDLFWQRKDFAATLDSQSSTFAKICKDLINQQ